MGAELAYGGLVEAFLVDDAEVIFIIKMNYPHDAPKIINPVGVIKRHAPAMWLGRETAQKQYLGVLGQEGLKGMLLYAHRSQS